MYTGHYITLQNMGSTMGQYLDTSVDGTTEQIVLIFYEKIYYQNIFHERCQPGVYFTNWDLLNQPLDMDK